MILEELVESYKPNDRVISAMAKIKILAAVGPTASGKTTLMEALAENRPQFGLVLDETSRRPRTDEKQGVDFVFRKKEEIIEDAKNGDLVQVAIGPNGDLYCTRINSYPEQGMGLIALVPAAVIEFRKLPVASFKAVFIVPSTYAQWQKWLAKQADDSQWTDEQLKRRLEEAKQSFEFALSDGHLSFVLNDDTSSAVRRLLQVADDEPLDDKALARNILEDNYRKLLSAIDIK